MISVCLATYNGESFLKEQLTSILKQLGDDDEVVVSDDGSTDLTLTILQEFNDPRIKVFHHSKRKQKYSFDYATHNFENAINNSRGEVIFFSDQDDVWLDGKIAMFMTALADCDLVLSDCKVVDSQLNELYPSYFKLNKSRTGIVYNLINNSYLGCCMAFKRSLLNKSSALPFPKSLVPHDIWLGLLAERFGKVRLITSPTMLYRRHDGNLSSSSKKSSLSLPLKFYYRFRILFEFLCRTLNKSVD
ncbi:MAG: glycosyltransferase [Bacteroidales bacterium]|nr:glycosyltransferase [Bacteroidales bacterium]